MTRHTMLWASALALALCAGDHPATADDDDDESLVIDQIERIGIDELIDVAIRAAPKLARAKTDLEGARGEAQAARGIDDWRLTLDISATRKTNAVIAGQPVQTTANEQYKSKGGLRRDLPTGGQLRLELDATRLKDEYLVEDAVAANDPRTSKSSATRATGQVVLTHPLLRGLGRGVARAELEKANLSTDAGVLRAEVEAGELVRDVIDGYWELVHAAMTLEVKRASLKAAGEVLNETRLSVRKGDRAKTDLQSAEYAVAVREEGVLQAEIALQDTALSLRRVAGLEIGPDAISLWPKDLPDVSKAKFSVSKNIKRGLTRNPALRASVLDGKSATIDVRVAQNGKRPRLDVTLSGGAVGTGRNFDDSVRQLGESTEYQVSAGVSFSFDIGNNAAKGAARSALARNRRARIDIEELRREVASSIVLTIHRIRAARKRSQVAGKAADLAIANLRAERARFQAGLSSSRELYERQGEIDDARLSRARALADYHQAVARLQTLTGRILQVRGVEVLED